MPGVTRAGQGHVINILCPGLLYVIRSYTRYNHWKRSRITVQPLRNVQQHVSIRFFLTQRSTLQFKNVFKIMFYVRMCLRVSAVALVSLHTIDLCLRHFLPLIAETFLIYISVLIIYSLFLYFHKFLLFNSYLETSCK